jgi:hypothetical protein
MQRGIAKMILKINKSISFYEYSDKRSEPKLTGIVKDIVVPYFRTAI